MIQVPEIGEIVVPTQDADIPLSSQSPTVKSGKKSKGVRFQTDQGDIFVPERKEVPSGIRRLERQSSRPRATEALDYLLAGNRRFREGNLERCIGGSEIIGQTAEDVAKPSTVILSCSDSRAPPEVVCDMGLGDCHVVRVGGNVVNEFVLGSIMFAVQHVGCSLVVVLAHSRCSVVASAVQNWARNKSRPSEGDDARSLAETVQQTLGNSPSLPNKTIDRNQLLQSSQPTQSTPPSASKPQTVENEVAASSEIGVSPFSSMAAQPYQGPQSSQKKDGFLAKCCSCFSQPDQPDPRAADAVSGASTPMRTQGEGIGERGRGPSNDRSSHGGRHFMRQSVNPLSALVGAIGGVVESVASSGQHDSLKGLARKEKQKQKDKGYDSDDEDLKRGLQKQDSLEFTRARLAKSRQEKRMEALRLLSERDDVDVIIDENAKASATKILQGLVKNLDADIVQQVEVVAAKYDIRTGSVRVLSRNWYSTSQRAFYSSPT